MPRIRYRASALVALIGCSVSAYAAEPPSQSASPAVSGEQLENLQRETPPAAQTSAESSAATPQAQPPRSAARNDRLELDTTVVTGNRELPKVLYIVPWKKAELGELPAQPFNTLLDEVLTPVDRDVFRREVTYYGAVSGASSASDSVGASPSERSEK